MSIFTMSSFAAVMSVNFDMLFSCYWLEVKRIAAQRHLTNMVQHFGWRIKKFVDQTMNSFKSIAFTVNKSVDPFSFSSGVSNPQPAAGIGFDDKTVLQVRWKRTKFDTQHSSSIIARKCCGGAFCLKGGY